MATPVPVYEPAAVAEELAASLNQHRGLVAPTIATAATAPMFTRESNGALVHRDGRVVVPAPASK